MYAQDTHTCMHRTHRRVCTEHTDVYAQNTHIHVYTHTHIHTSEQTKMKEMETDGLPGY